LKFFLDLLGHGFVLGLVEDNEETFFGREEDVGNVAGKHDKESHADDVRVHSLFFVHVREDGSIQIATERVDGEDTKRNVDQGAEPATDGN